MSYDFTFMGREADVDDRQDSIHWLSVFVQYQPILSPKAV